MEEDKKCISFEIKTPKTISESEFIALVYRLEKLKNNTEFCGLTVMEMHDHNRNIQEMQDILEHFKIHLIEGEE